MGGATPPLPAGFKLDSDPPPPPGFKLDTPAETSTTTPPGSMGGTGKPLNIVPIREAFPGQTLKINLLRRQPEMLPQFLKEKGYQPLPKEGAEGQALFAGPDGRVIDANEFLPASGMVIHGPPVALQTGAAMTSLATGPLAPATEATLGAGASVGGDLYDAMLNKMYGLPSGLSVGGEIRSAAEGALAQGAPAGLESLSGVTKAATVARTAMADATKAGEDLAAKQAEIRSGQAAKVRVARKKFGTSETAELRDKLAADRLKLGNQVVKGMEEARPAVAEQVGRTATEGMLGKTPEQLSAERAQTIEPIAQRRAQAQSPYFDAAHALHEEVGAKFNPYIEPIKKNPLDQLHEDGLVNQIDQIEQWGLQNGQRIDDPTLNRIFNRIKDASNPAKNDPLVRTGEAGQMGRTIKPGDVNPRGANFAAQIAAQSDEKASQPLTYGEVWGMRAQANKVLATSRNPGARYAAHQFVDAATEMMPNVPQAIKNQYATERTWFGPSLTGKVARAEAPQQVGEAIWSAPVEVQQEIIRRAATPEAKEGLRLSFADNFLGNKMKPDDLAKFDPKVLHNLYGSDANSVLKLLGPEGKVKSAPWEALIQHDPASRDAFDSAYRDVLQRDEVVATRKAIDEGQALLRDMPNQTMAKQIQAELDAAKLPAEKLAILQKSIPDPKLAAVEALGKMSPSRLEGIMNRRGAWIGLGASLGGYRYLFRNPAGLVALATGGAVLGGRAGVRYALSRPGVAGLFVDMLSRPAAYRNAAVMGRFMAGISEGAMLQSVKESGADQSLLPWGSTPQSNP